jgi:putative transposase
MRLYGCQQHLINQPQEVTAVLEYICSEANKLTNCGIYFCRQIWFKANYFVKKYELDEQLKNHPHFKAMRSACAQQTLHNVVESFTSFRRLNKLYKAGQLHFKPKLPNYRKKGGLAVVSYPARWVKLIDGQLKFSLGNQVKAWFGIDHFLLPMPSNLDFESIKEYRIVPRNNNLYIEFVYKQPDVEKVEANGNVLGIDPGLNNWLTCVSNIGKSFIVDGHKMKSQNQWYNKQVAQLKSGKAQDYWDDQLAGLTEKRNRQMRDNINKTARFIINWCLSNQISKIVFGWNKFNKDGINIGKKNNQEFVQIPTARLKNRISQLCEQYGIQFTETEESYTSQASFLDDDFLPKFGEKPPGWEGSGKRVKRGLYRTSNGELINADCNGAANILRKVATQLNLDLTEVSRAVLTLPKRYSLGSMSKSYRQRCEARIYPA